MSSIDSEKEKLFKEIENTKESFFITGKAGTGKSYFLEHWKKHTKKKNYVFLAPTGVAALNIKGKTIHAFFGINYEKPLEESIEIKKNNELLKKLEVIIIDEISMVSKELLDIVDKILKKNRDSRFPFGGVQMIFLGDLFQLPPVKADYFFKAEAFSDPLFEWEFRELYKIHRQKLSQMDEIYNFFIRIINAIGFSKEERKNTFVEILNHIREGNYSYQDLENLNTRVKKNNEVNTISLCTKNDIANDINEKELEKLEGKAIKYYAQLDGTYKFKREKLKDEKLDKEKTPAPVELFLKIGAMVMTVKNDTDRHFVNGSIGKVKKMSEKFIDVEFENRKEERLKRETWEDIDYYLENGEVKTKINGTFKQFPLKLAWAITIHKSQGKTFDAVHVNLGGEAFATGQTYVALSRCKSLHGISLEREMKIDDIKVDQTVVDFYQSCREKEKFENDQYPKMSLDECIQKGECEYIEFKSSLRWDYQQGKINEELFTPISKTIVAFLNTKGGTLLIGVNDDGEILGLEKDYETFSKGEKKSNKRDLFKRKLVEVINKNIGREYHNDWIEIDICEEEDICRVDVKKKNSPSYLKINGKSEFYHRASASSQLLDAQQTTDYIKSHFPS